MTELMNYPKKIYQSFSDDLAPYLVLTKLQKGICT